MRSHLAQYIIVIEPDEEEPHRYNERAPALPGCLTYGESVEDVLGNAVEAIQGSVAVLVGAGEPVPIEQQARIAVSPADVPVAD